MSGESPFAGTGISAPVRPTVPVSSGSCSKALLGGAQGSHPQRTCCLPLLNGGWGRGRDHVWRGGQQLLPLFSPASVFRRQPRPSLWARYPSWFHSLHLGASNLTSEPLFLRKGPQCFSFDFRNVPPDTQNPSPPDAAAS